MKRVLSNYYNNQVKRSKEDESSKVSVERDGRSIRFFDEINNETVCEAFKHIDAIEREHTRKPLTIIINSYGGNVHDGLALYDRLRSCKCPTEMIGTGFVGSMAFIVFLAADKRIVTPNVTFMNHQNSGEVEGNTLGIICEAKEFERLENFLIDLIVERTNMNKRTIKNKTRSTNHYIGVQEALEYNICHEVIDEIIK